MLLEITKSCMKKSFDDIISNHCMKMVPYNNMKHLQCNYCGKVFREWYNPNEESLGRDHSDKVFCEQVPEDIKKQFLKMLQNKSSDVSLLRPPKVEVASGSESVNAKKGSLNYFVQRGPNLIGK